MTIPLYTDEQFEPTAYAIGPGTIWLSPEINAPPSAHFVRCDYCDRFNSQDHRNCEGCGAPTRYGASKEIS